MSTKIHIFLIDGQNDFCKPNGSLYVPGADEDMQRAAKMINRLGSKIDDIHLTLDSHHLIDVAHPIFWIDTSTGKSPAPFTLITADDVNNGKYTTRNPRWLKRATDYVNELKTNNRYALCIWPPHCIIGSEGYALHSDLFAAVQGWENDNFAMANMITKGSNFWTEHYSIFKADVPDPTDPSTMMNLDLVKSLQEADVIAVMGEALNFCVANSINDLMDVFGTENIKKLVLIEDCVSAVPGYDAASNAYMQSLTDNFMDKFLKAGGQVSTSDKFYA